MKLDGTGPASCFAPHRGIGEATTLSVCRGTPAPETLVANACVLEPLVCEDAPSDASMPDEGDQHDAGPTDDDMDGGPADATTVDSDGSRPAQDASSEDASATNDAETGHSLDGAVL